MKKKIECITAASSKLKSGVRARTINPKNGSSTVGIELDEQSTIELATYMLAVAQDKKWRGRGKIIVTGHKNTNQVTVLRRE